MADQSTKSIGRNAARRRVPEEIQQCEVRQDGERQCSDELPEFKTSQHSNLDSGPEYPLGLNKWLGCFVCLASHPGKALHETSTDREHVIGLHGRKLRTLLVCGDPSASPSLAFHVLAYNEGTLDALLNVNDHVDPDLAVKTSNLALNSANMCD